MMSISINLPRKAPPSSVQRSNSVPANLAQDAQEFMKTVVEQSIISSTTSIPEGRALCPSQLADSIRTQDGGEHEDFFLPMDEEEDEPIEDVSSPRTRQQISRALEQQQHRQMAIARLQEFFLGESFSSPNLTAQNENSPVSLLGTVPRPTIRNISLHDHGSTATTEVLPKRNIFGQIIVEDSNPTTMIPRCSSKGQPQQHSRTQSADSGSFLEAEVEQEDASSISTREILVEFPSPSSSWSDPRSFTKLKASDRAQSLPLEYMTCGISNSYRSSSTTNNSSVGPSQHPPLNKKPSLKKISSFGQGLSRKDSSCDGSLQQTVSFSSLSIREYPPAISDNPSCSFGPPVQLDWDFEAEETHPIDHYEEYRQPRRASHDLLLSYYDRRFLLIKQAGYSRREVKEAMKEAERVKRERMVTDLFLPAQALDETMENMVNTVKRFFTKTSNAPQDVY